MLDLQFAELSDRGRVREQNEDCLGSVIPKTPAHAETQGWLFALADGVGGHGGGDVASRVAIETVCGGFRASRDYELHRALLPRLLQQANATVLEAAAASRKAGAGMATTMVACAIRSDRAVICHVGDSRCYLVRRGHGEVLTRDHTVANDQIRLGILSRREAADSPMKHMLSRSLGGDLFVAVDVSEHQLLPGDVLLLCSDGLHGALPSVDIELIISVNPDLRVAAKELIEAANQRDGSDNVSVQLIRVRNVERTGMYRGRPYKLT
ncbi:MAG TPA: protein phosphatase 2C domain-containing protein [Terriglobales bacterium]|nr:protein phosphatase 2C domain-containing protein [Terriglobales bacterium]